MRLAVFRGYRVPTRAKMGYGKFMKGAYKACRKGKWRAGGYKSYLSCVAAKHKGSKRYTRKVASRTKRAAAKSHRAIDCGKPWYMVASSEAAFNKECGSGAAKASESGPGKTTSQPWWTGSWARTAAKDDRDDLIGSRAMDGYRRKRRGRRRYGFIPSPFKFGRHRRRRSR